MAGRGGATARLVVLCGLLLGLFLMHGSPASAAGGCHPPTHGSASHGAAGPEGGTGHDSAAMPGGRPAHAEAAQAEADPAGTGAAEAGVKAAAPERGFAFGQSCVSTAARGGGLPLAGPLPAPTGVVAPVAGSGVQETRAGGDGCRAPPGGRELLIRVCVART